MIRLAFRYFTKALQSEILKSRKTVALWLTVLYPLFTVSLVMLSQFVKRPAEDYPWTTYAHNLSGVGSFFLPFFMVLIVAFYCFVEHKSNAWKHLLAQPVPKWSLFAGKLAMILLLLLISLLFFVIFSWFSMLVLHHFSARMSYKNGGLPFDLLLVLFSRSYLAAMAIIAIQYWLSFRFKNLIVPVVIGLALVILPIAQIIIFGVSGLIRDANTFKEIIQWDPYSYPFSHVFNFTKESRDVIVIIPKMTIIWLCVSVTLFYLGYLDFSRKNIL